MYPFRQNKYRSVESDSVHFPVEDVVFHFFKIPDSLAYLHIFTLRLAFALIRGQ